jgi:hypothetical protein
MRMIANNLRRGKRLQRGGFIARNPSGGARVGWGG